MLRRAGTNKKLYYYILTTDELRCKRFALKMETAMISETAMMQSLCTLCNGTRSVTDARKDCYGACSKGCTGRRYS